MPALPVFPWSSTEFAKYQIDLYFIFEDLTDMIHDAVQTNRRVPTAEERREKRPRGALFAAQSEAQSPIPDKRQRVVDVADALPPLPVSLRQHVVDLAASRLQILVRNQEWLSDSD